MNREYSLKILGFYMRERALLAIAILFALELLIPYKALPQTAAVNTNPAFEIKIDYSKLNKMVTGTSSAVSLEKNPELIRIAAEINANNQRAKLLREYLIDRNAPQFAEHAELIAQTKH